jgi:hypothetical protein
MKLPGHIVGMGFRKSRSGSAVIYALIVIAAGAFVLAGWVHVLAARVTYTEQMSLALKRRVILDNSRLLASEYLIEGVLPGTATGTNSVSWTNSSGVLWGAFTMGAVSPLPLQSLTQPTQASPFSPAGASVNPDSTNNPYPRGYTTALQASLADGMTNYPWTFQARSRGPVFGFDLATIKQGGSATGTIGVAASAAFGTTNGAVVSGQYLNVPSPPEVWGTDAYFAAAPTEREEIEPLTSKPDDAGKTERYTCDGAGAVTIYLKRDVAERKYYIGVGLTSLTFSDDAVDPGVDVSGYGAIRVISTSATLAGVSLPAGNQRRLYLGVSNTGGVTVSVAGTSQIRLAAVFRNSPVNFALAGNLQVKGGVETDAVVSASGGNLTFVRETDPKFLDQYSDRQAWGEAYRQ